MGDDRWFPYLDRVLGASHDVPPSLHLGYWAAPIGDDLGALDPAAALDELVIGLADLADGQTILDVGCGLGATLARVGLRHDATLVGLNVDPRQLDVCRTHGTRTGRPVLWVRSDAVDLPFRASQVDRLLCIEAAPHFSSRSRFLEEAARVLTPGGRLVGTDIFVLSSSGDDGSWADGDCERVLQLGTGSWPHVFETEEQVRIHAEHVGFRVVQWVDISENVAPNFVATSANVELPSDPVADMIACLGDLQRRGRLRSTLFSLERRD
jgi:cyclopropane fatty-acyl-phospholipid synthase-like methyltransferase